MFEYLGKRRLMFLVGLLVLLIIIGVAYGFLSRVPAEAEETPGGDNSNGEKGTAYLSYRLENQSVLIFERHYAKCNDVLSDESAMTHFHLGKTRADMELAYPRWRLTDFTPEKVVFRKEIDGYCPMHYIIKEKEGYLAVYRSHKETGELYIEDELNVRFDWLERDVQEQIRNGLVVDTAEEVEQLVENWMS